jgi:hypothetical protein
MLCNQASFSLGSYESRTNAFCLVAGIILLRENVLHLYGPELELKQLRKIENTTVKTH